MKEITVNELKKMMENKEDFQLIDVRELHEVEISNMGGEHIPMGEVMHTIDKISKNKPVIIHCKSGARSAAVIQALETQHKFTNLLNLKGGILAYLEDSSVTKND